MSLLLIPPLKAVSTATCLIQSMAKSHDNKVPKLPEKLIVGYANWNQCDDKIVEAAINGVNVIIWFSINLDINPGMKHGNIDFNFEQILIS